MRKFVLLISFILVGSFLSEGKALGQSCEQLSQMLSQPAVKNVAAASIKSYKSAVKKQTKLLTKLNADLKRYGCNHGSQSNACVQLRTSQIQMDRNLTQLTSKLRQLNSNSSFLTKREIRTRMAKKGCVSASFVSLKRSIETETLENGVKLYRGKTANPENFIPFANIPSQKDLPIHLLKPGQLLKKPTSANQIVKIPAARARYGQYRTLCVRTCDGFYFPISSNTNSNSFARDELACNMMCPNVRTELFIHQPAYQKSGDMISYRSEEVYKNQSYAFDYRDNELSSDQNCGCNLSAYFEEMNRRERLLKGEKDWTENASEIASELDNLRDSQTPTINETDVGTAMANKVSDDVVDQLVFEPPSDRKIRKVGPVFFPDQTNLFDP